MKSLNEGKRGGVNYLFEIQLHFVNKEPLFSHGDGDITSRDPLTNCCNVAFLHRVDVSCFTLFDIQPATGKYI